MLISTSAEITAHSNESAAPIKQKTTSIEVVFL
jgi:hypothetical protein